MTGAVHCADLVTFRLEKFRCFRKLSGEQIEIWKSRNDLAIVHANERSRERKGNLIWFTKEKQMYLTVGTTILKVRFSKLFGP